MALSASLPPPLSGEHLNTCFCNNRPPFSTLQGLPLYTCWGDIESPKQEGSVYFYDCIFSCHNKVHLRINVDPQILNLHLLLLNNYLLSKYFSLDKVYRCHKRLSVPHGRPYCCHQIPNTTQV